MGEDRKMVATKAQLVDFIIANFEEPGNSPVSKTKLESYKKAELEEFINEKSSEDEVTKWIASK